MIPTSRPAPPPTVAEAPPEIAALFMAWRAAPADDRSGPLYDLVQAMYGRRSTWFALGPWVFWLRKNDSVVVVPRLSYLPTGDPVEL